MPFFYFLKYLTTLNIDQAQYNGVVRLEYPAR